MSEVVFGSHLDLDSNEIRNGGDASLENLSLGGSITQVISSYEIPDSTPTTLNSIAISGITYPTTPFTTYLNKSSYTLNTAQTINSGTNLVYVNRAENTFSEATSPDISKLWIYGNSASTAWSSPNPAWGIVGADQHLSFSGNDVGGRTTGALTTFSSGMGITPVASSTQTITNATATATNVSVSGSAASSTQIISTMTGMASTLYVALSGASSTAAITDAYYFRGVGNYLRATGAGGSVTITNLYGLKLETPTNTTGLTVTNNYGIYQEWASASNLFAGPTTFSSSITVGTTINGRDPDDLAAGPASATDNALVRFDGTTGKLVQNSGITVDDSGKVTSNLTVSKATPALFIASTGTTSAYQYFDTTGVGYRGLFFTTSGSNRWAIRATNGAESGSNAGSDFFISAYSDAGSSLRTDLLITRSTGKTTLGSVGATAGLELGSSGPRVMSGTGSPEGVVTAPVGSTWRDTAAGLLYWKQTGTGNTGWVKNVTGPTASTDNALARFDGTNGAVQNSGITVDDSGNVSSNLTVSKASAVIQATATGGTSPSIRVAGDAGTLRDFAFYTGANSRWFVRCDNVAESGGDAGSNFVIAQKLDSGASPSYYAVTINRATGKTTLGSVGATAGLEFGSSGPRVMSGTGSPEGVVTAPVGSQWIDTAATTGAIKWLKASGSGSSGWVVEYGDTGWRNITALATANAGQTLADLMVRRIGTVVYVHAQFAQSTTGTAFTLVANGSWPTGFRAPTQTDETTIMGSRGGGAGPPSAVLAIETNSAGPDAAYRVDNASYMYFNGSFPTADAWPSSLPGSAA